MSPHFGSVNLIPLAIAIFDPVKDRVILEAYANEIMNQDTIWTKWGLRSLSKNDDIFGKNNNYYTGPIWINIHYMLLRVIKLYYWEIPKF